MNERLPIAELELLRQFEQRDPGGWYAEGFELYGPAEYGRTSGIDTWSKDPQFLHAFLAFATANHSGSIYALWRLDGHTDDGTDLATLPVVVFGDEGGVHVVARSLRELFQLLTCDARMWATDECAYFYADEIDEVDEDHEPSRRHPEYVDWLKREFGLDPVADPDGAIDAAQDELGERFDAWMRRYVDDH
ncbi:hypothetical protein [Streptomyces gilvosporeus]|uniref:Uncharacterized protein n=1 Tax=Streptomyces gilvosporeus TaxID=553510 RepID=A0A1V0TQA2_9ACTN|nr:hypothetical protein [Streptomyces gilvosporeus]ARF54958.1 hypothetical protein B1H19_12715 [Streptomyces gilvosporeus]